MADPADVNVDELRRRARRRLVGAIVLALAAAVFVPCCSKAIPSRSARMFRCVYLQSTMANSSIA